MARAARAHRLTGWAAALVPYLKALHIGTIAIWCAGLVALPMMLARHDPSIAQADYTRVRHASHYTYTLVVTPAGVVAIAAGTVLIFLRETFVPWMFAKLVLVAGLVAFHAWVGHTLVEVAETAGEHDPPEPLLPVILGLAPMVAILALVLAKPDLTQVPMPGWLTRPVGVQLPLDVPRR